MRNVISNEVYNNMAGQFNKISEILERTFEELEEKHSKMEFHIGLFSKKIDDLEENSQNMQGTVNDLKENHI